MTHTLPVHSQDPRSFYELLVDCEARAMVSRIATTVYNFFKTIVLSIINGCNQFRDRIIEFIDPKKKFINLSFGFFKQSRAELPFYLN